MSGNAGRRNGTAFHESMTDGHGQPGHLQHRPAGRLRPHRAAGAAGAEDRRGRTRHGRCRRRCRRSRRAGDRRFGRRTYGEGAEPRRRRARADAGGPEDTGPYPAQRRAAGGADPRGEGRYRSRPVAGAGVERPGGGPADRHSLRDDLSRRVQFPRTAEEGLEPDHDPRRPGYRHIRLRRRPCLAALPDPAGAHRRNPSRRRSRPVRRPCRLRSAGDPAGAGMAAARRCAGCDAAGALHPAGRGIPC